MSYFGFVTRLALASAGAGLLSFGLGGVASADPGSGNDVGVSVEAPVTVCGNGVGLLEPGSGSCSTPANPPASVSAAPGGAGDGVLSGNGVAAGVVAPVTICGNGIGGSGSCAPASGGAPAGGSNPSGGASPGGVPASPVSGNTVQVDAAAPITVCGNAVGVLDPATGTCTTGAAPSAAPAAAVGTGGGLFAGNAVIADVDAPVTACGNAVGVAAGASSSCGSAASTGGPSPTTPASTTPGSTTPAGDPDGDNGTGNDDSSTDLARSLLNRAISPVLPASLATTGTTAALLALLGLVLAGTGRATTLLSRGTRRA